ncbi:MAG: VCBS repeat-containing protein [Saprospiraceae bacterium]
MKKSFPKICRALRLAAGLLFFQLWACQNTSRDTLFTALSPAETGIVFENTLPEESPLGMNIIQYLYYYNGGGVAAGDVDNDGLCDLFFTSNLGPCRLYRNLGNLKFEDITEKSGLLAAQNQQQIGTEKWTTGCSMADVNGDGWLDIYVCQVGQYKKFSGRNLLFINNKDGSFTERAAEFGLDVRAFSTQAAFFDFDRDGDLDCYLLCHSVHSPESYKDTSVSRQFDPLASDRFFKNEGGRFVDFTQKVGLRDGKSGYGLGLAVGDLNGDHWPDVYVSNDFHENDFLLYNIEGQRFTEGIAASIGHTSNFSMGCDMADCNNDGRPDIVTLDMKPEDETTLKASAPADPFSVYEFKHSYGYHWQFPRNCLQLNRGTTDGGRRTVGGSGIPSTVHRPPFSVFSEIGQLAGVAATDWSWSALFADLDLDGNKDLFVTNGIPHRPNDSDYNKFTASAQAASDLDLVKKMPSGAAKNYCFKNGGRWTADGGRPVIFEDVSQKWGLDHEGFSNGAAYADLDNDGDLDLVTNNLNESASIFRNNTTGQNWVKIRLRGDGANPFGIGAQVKTSAGGTTQTFENQPVRGFQSAVEPVLTIGLGETKQVNVLQITWPDGRWQTLQNVAPNQVLDIKPENTRLLSEMRQTICETCGEEPNQFFERENENAGTANYLVFNDLTREKLLPWSIVGQKIQPPIPEIRENIACLRPCDFDADGDEDLFVGSRSVTGAYGISPKSYLLENQGNGAFNDRSGLLSTSSSGGGGGTALGMVTDATWADVDGDRRPDLVVVGEWMSVTIFRNAGADLKFEKLEIPQSAGLWNCVAAGDFDGDGDPDFVAGNLGLNSNLQASPTEPLGLWVKDWDRNGDFDPILTYFRQGKNWVFWDKDLLASQIPGIKKHFVQYRKYAESTFDEVFPPGERADATERKAEVLASCLIENQGNGKFALRPLPLEAQFAPVFAALPGDFDGDGKLDVLLGGNLHDVAPAIGRFDGSIGSFLRGDGRGTFEPISPAASGFAVGGEVRGLEFLPGKKGLPGRIIVRKKDGSAEIFRERD